jgi:hypothetical protein
MRRIGGSESVKPLVKGLQERHQGGCLGDLEVEEVDSRGARPGADAGFGIAEGVDEESQSGLRMVFLHLPL